GGGARDGPGPSRAFRGAARHAQPAAHPLVALPCRRGATLDRHPRRRIRRLERSSLQRGAHRQLHLFPQIRLQRAQRPGLRLHVEPGAVRDLVVARGDAIDSAGTPQRGRSGRRRLLAALPPRALARAARHALSHPRRVHGQWVPDAGPDLRPDDGRPGQRNHDDLLARVPDRVSVLQVRAGYGDPVHPHGLLPRPGGPVPQGRVSQARRRGSAMRRRANRAVVYALVAVIALFLVGPFVWLFVTSVSYQRNLLARPLAFVPPEVTLDNYRMVLGMVRFHAEGQAAKILPSMLNSLIVAAAVTIVNLVIGTTAGYAYARFRVPLKTFSLFALLFTRMLPTVVLIPAYFLLFKALGLQNTLTGLVLAYCSFTLPFTVWIMKAYFETIPTDLDKSALVDGCNRLQAYYWIVLPVSGPGLVASGAFTFMLCWNEFIVAQVLNTKPGTTTLPPVIAGMNGQINIDYSVIAASGFLGALPAVLLVLFFQKYMVQGLTAGSIKG